MELGLTVGIRKRKLISKIKHFERVVETLEIRSSDFFPDDFVFR